MKRFNLTQLFLFVTWFGIAFFVITQLLGGTPYRGETYDLKVATFFDYAFDEQFETTLGSTLVHDSPPWDAQQLNPPVSARSALSIAEDVGRRQPTIRDA